MTATTLKNPTSRQNAAKQTRPTRILCVDDDPDIQTTIEMRMREFDVEVDHAFYGTQGIFEAMKSRPDLIVMDLAMPNGSGEYLLNNIKTNATTADIPVIVLTGMRDPELKRRVLLAGAGAFLNKPVRFEELLHQMSRFVDVRRLDQDNANDV